MVKHLACIMDGNRRWAIKQGLLPIFGHQKGSEAVKIAINFCLAKKIAYLSLYAFSIENLQQRTAQEQAYLFECLAHEMFFQYLEEFKKKDIMIRFVGDRTLFPKSIRSLCEKVEKETSTGSTLIVTFFICYGGRQEIVDTVKRIAVKVKKGDLQEADITQDVVNCFLWTNGLPYPDLIIRTGGRYRLSNFLLFQAAYSEFYFFDCLWPDITEQDLQKAVTYFNDCQQNFGQ